MVNIPYMGTYSGFIICIYIYIYSVYVVNKHMNNIIYINHQQVQLVIHV